MASTSTKKLIKVSLFINYYNDEVPKEGTKRLFCIYVKVNQCRYSSGYFVLNSFRLILVFILIYFNEKMSILKKGTLPIITANTCKL